MRTSWKKRVWMPREYYSLSLAARGALFDLTRWVEEDGVLEHRADFTAAQVISCLVDPTNRFDASELTSELVGLGAIREYVGAIVISCGNLDLDRELLAKTDAEFERMKRAIRLEVFARCGNKCAYCGADSDLTLDHVLSRSRGGTHALSNLVAACRRCNSSKGQLTPHEWPGGSR